MTDLEQVFAALQAKYATYDALWKYYDGDQPLVYSNERLREIFRGLDARFSQNWCAVVIDSVLDRLQLTRFQVDGGAQQALDTLWQMTEMNLDDHEVHTAVLVTGEAFVIVWPDESGAVSAYYNDPRLVHMVYEAENPHVPRLAGKWWADDGGLMRLTLYYPDRLEYYASNKKFTDVASAKALELQDVAPNPYGEIPVFHFRRTRRRLLSELANVVEQQNAINKLLADMMVAAEFGAFRQRYVIANADVGSLKNAPNEIWSIPAGDGVGQASQVGEFEQTDLGNYLAAIDKLAASIAAITRTPKHYFWQQGGDPSGEALIAQESPLTRKAARYAELLTPVWRNVAAFMLRVAGQVVDSAAITPVWGDPETVQPMTEAQIALTSTQAGIPLRVVLARQGWDEQELADLDAALTAQQEQQRETLAAAVLRAQRAMDSGAADNGMVQGDDNATA